MTSGVDETARGTTSRQWTGSLQPIEAWAFLVLLAFIPLIGATFGIGNQVEQFPLIARAGDPDYLAGDFYVNSAAGFGPRFYYAHAMAWLSDPLPLVAVVHGLSILCTFALAAVSFVATRRLLGATALAGAIAAVLAVANDGFSLGYAAFLRFDSFQPASIAIPLALWGLYFQISLRPWAALPLFAVAALMHPLIGVEIALVAHAAACLSILAVSPVGGRARAFMANVGAGLGFAGFIALAYIWPMSGLPDQMRLTDAEFFAILPEFRAPHHYLGLSFPEWAVTPFVVFAALVAALLVVAYVQGAPRRTVIALAAACLVVCAVAALSLYFVDVRQNRAWATAQVFRILLVVKWVGFLLLGWVLARAITHLPRSGLVALVVTATATANAQPRVMGVMLVALLTVFVLEKRLPERRMPWAEAAVMAGAALVGLYLTYRYGTALESARALLGLGALALIALPIYAAPLRFAGAGLAVALVVGVVVATRDTGPFGWAPLATDLTWSDRDDPAEDAARAAERLSPKNAIWLIPPTHENFRLLAGRAAVVDFTSIPFGDDGLREWKARIDALYGPVASTGFAALREMSARHRDAPNIHDAAMQFGAGFAILHRETPWDGPVLYENEAFKAVALNGPGQ